MATCHQLTAISNLHAMAVKPVQAAPMERREMPFTPVVEWHDWVQKRSVLASSSAETTS